MNNAKTANIIKVKSKERGISVAQILATCKIRKSLIYDMEKRDFTPSAEVLEKIADVLDCSVDYLLGRTDIPEINKSVAATSSDLPIFIENPELINEPPTTLEFDVAAFGGTDDTKAEVSIEDLLKYNEEN